MDKKKQPQKTFNRAFRAHMIAKRKPLTKKVVQDAYLLMASVGFMIAKIDDLSETPFYQFSLKNKGNAFVEELLKLEGRIVDANTKMEQDEEDRAFSQMSDSYIFFENMLNCIFKIPEKRMEIFNNYIEKGIEIYGGDTKII